MPGTLRGGSSPPVPALDSCVRRNDRLKPPAALQAERAPPATLASFVSHTVGMREKRKEEKENATAA